jgi:hypothetical protein
MRMQKLSAKGRKQLRSVTEIVIEYQSVSGVLSGCAVAERDMEKSGSLERCSYTRVSHYKFYATY